MGEKMINLTIDGVQLQVPEGTSVMSAAAGVGIEVPHLCFLKDINEISACKACVVEVQGKSKLITACNSPVEEGMVVYTNSPKVRRVRKTNVELILSQHDCHCDTCVRSRNCNLQQISNDLGILEVPFTEEVPETPWDHSFPLIRDSRKCIKCMRCVQICDKVQAMHVWDVQNTGSRPTVDGLRALRTVYYPLSYRSIAGTGRYIQGFRGTGGSREGHSSPGGTGGKNRMGRGTGTECGGSFRGQNGGSAEAHRF